MTDLQKWLVKKDRKLEMAKAYVEGKTVAEIAIDFGKPIPCIRYAMLDFMPMQEDIDVYKRKFVAKQIKNRRYE